MLVGNRKRRRGHWRAGQIALQRRRAVRDLIGRLTDDGSPYLAMRRVELGWGVGMEPDDFVPFVLGEAVLVQEIEGVVPVATNAKVENTETDFLGYVGEVVFWIRAQ